MTQTENLPREDDISMEKRFCWPVRPVALRENTIQGEKYRFTVLLPGLIRMEYAPEGIFEQDRGRFCVLDGHRTVPVSYLGVSFSTTM